MKVICACDHCRFTVGNYNLCVVSYADGTINTYCRFHSTIALNHRFYDTGMQLLYIYFPGILMCVSDTR